MTDNTDVEELLTADDIVVPDIPCDTFEVYKEVRIEAKLRSLCNSICERFDIRVKVTPFMKSAIQAFNDSDKFAWFTNIKYR